MTLPPVTRMMSCKEGKGRESTETIESEALKEGRLGKMKLHETTRLELCSEDRFVGERESLREAISKSVTFAFLPFIRIT